jgi:hypothetical protein
MRLRTLIVGLLLLAVGTGTAVAASGTTLHTTKTFSLKADQTRTFKVTYPDALKYGKSKYSGKVQILRPTNGAHGSQPSLRKVHILSKGSCVGGSVLCVKVRDGNKAGTAAVRVKITATTQLPPGKKP